MFPNQHTPSIFTHFFPATITTLQRTTCELLLSERMNGGPNNITFAASAYERLSAKVNYRFSEILLFVLLQFKVEFEFFLSVSLSSILPLSLVCLFGFFTSQFHSSVLFRLLVCSPNIRDLSPSPVRMGMKFPWNSFTLNRPRPIAQHNNNSAIPSCRRLGLTLIITEKRS